MNYPGNKLAKTIRKSVSNLLGRNVGRSISVYDDDVFIVSYPKSGNTWLRFIIANLISNHEVNLNNIDKIIPDIYKIREKKLLQYKSPRIMKSHEYFDDRYRKLIYVVRDPRDVAVSYYYYLKKIGFIPDELPITNFVNSYVAGEVDEYGSWGEHIGGWLEKRKDNDSFLLIRYEDLKIDAIKETASVVEFINLKVEKEDIEKAVKLSSFDRLKLKETKHSASWAETMRTNKDIPFFRSGRAHAWVDELEEESAKLIKDRWEETMKMLGYS